MKSTSARSEKRVGKPYNCAYNEADQIVMRMSAAAMRAYMAIKVRSSAKDGTAWPSYRTLAEDTGVSMQTMKQGVRELKAAGILTVTKRPATSSVFDLSSARPTKRNGGYAGEDKTTLSAPEPEKVSGQGGNDSHTHRGYKNLTPGGYKNLTPNNKKEQDEEEQEVGCGNSNPHPARARADDRQDFCFDDLPPDPKRDQRRLRVQHDRFLAEQGTTNLAGRLDWEASIADVRAEVDRCQRAGDTPADVLDDVLIPLERLDVVYSDEKAVGVLGDPGRPFAAERGEPAEFCALLGVEDGDHERDYARSVWDRVRQAASWGELTPRVVAAAVDYLGPAGDLIAQRAGATGSAAGWTFAADSMVLEIWCQVKAQRMSIRNDLGEEEIVSA